jgi:oligosaccharyltransferase complex subunit alpha (ribophorin I)
MNRVSQRPAMLAAFLLLSFTLVNADVNPNLIYSKVSRKIDLTSQLAKVSTTITLENVGDKAIGFFYYAIEPSAMDKVAYISAMVSLFFLKFFT